MVGLVAPTLTTSQLAQLQVLEYLYDHAETLVDDVGLGPLHDALGFDETELVVGGLVENGYVHSDAHLAGHVAARLLPAGQDVVERVQAHRQDMVERNKTVRDRVLRWIHSQGPGARPVLARFFEAPVHALFYGAPFIDAEVSHASMWLRDEGLIAGQGAHGGGILRPKMTPMGDRLVESGRSVNDHAGSATPQVSNVFHAPANVAIGGSNVTQSVVVQQAVDGLAEVAKIAREAIELLAAAGADSVELTSAIDEAERAKDARGPGAIRGALSKLRDAVGSGVTSAVAKMISQRIDELLQLFAP